MKINLYTVNDKIAKVHTSPMAILNDDVAMRIMKNCVEDKTHNYALNPGDYDLYKIGTFDDTTSEIATEYTLVCKLASLITRQLSPSQINEELTQ